MKREKNTPLLRPLGAIAASFSLALTACDLKKPSASGGTVEGDNKSSHFDAVNAHLDLGGEMYAYMDVDGDVEKLAEWGNKFLKMAAEASGGDMPPQLANMDIRQLMGELGLDGIEAAGMSSYKNGKLYRNKMYAHIPEGRKGLLKLAGGEAGEFSAKALAPAGADMVYEMEMDLKSVYELAMKLATKYGGPEMAGQLAQMAAEPMPQVGLTMTEIFENLDTTAVAVMRLHPDKPMKLPEEVPVKIPGMDLLISIEGLGPIFDKITNSIPEDQRGEFLKNGDGFIDLSFPLPPEVMEIVQPVIRRDAKSGDVMIGSSAAFIAECLSGKSSVWDDDDFKSAMKDLPETGNALGYMSGEFATEYVRLYGDFIDIISREGGNDVPKGLSTMVKSMMQDLGLKPGIPQGSVIANLPEGILIDTNSGASMKTSVVAGGAGMMIGLVSGFTMPMYSSLQNSSSKAATLMTEEAYPATEAVRDRNHTEALENIESIRAGANRLAPAPVPADSQP